MSVISITVYKPKEGKEEEFREILKSHVPLLRGLGFAAFKPPFIMKSQNGNYVELIEWISKESIEKANNHPDLISLRKKLREVCEHSNLCSLEESKNELPVFELVNI